MRILFNASTSAIGGAIQTATNFIFECQADTESGIDWTFLVSAPVARNLESLGLQISDDPRFHVFNQSPSRSRAARQRAVSLVKAARPALVYTMSGPAYVSFPVFHVLGCSAPYVTHARFENYFSEGLLKGGYKVAESLAKLRHFHRADHLVFQTESSRQGFLRRGFWKAENSSVIPNAIGHAFTRAFPQMRLNPGGVEASAEGPVQVLIPSAFYTHKNLDIVVPVAKRLQARAGDKFRFLLTLPFKDAWKRIETAAAEAGVTAQVANHGPFSVSDAPNLYRDSAMLFLPTRLETFSASYLEAMWCGLPIVTSDLDFARDLCGEAALYANTLDPDQCAEAIHRVLSEPSLRERLTSAGFEQVGKFPTSHMRYRMIIDLLRDLASTKASIHNR